MNFARLTLEFGRIQRNHAAEAFGDAMGFEECHIALCRNDR
jgi:hypothetical protein